MSEFIEKYEIGQHSQHAITKMRDESGSLAVGNVLRRTCEKVEDEACKASCQLAQQCGRLASREADNTDKACADLNLLSAIEDLQLKPEEVLMVGVTANKVGYADEMDSYDTQPTDNPYGWKELPGYNAFFARTSEVSALGRRLADCADLNFEFEDSEGNTVIGFEHGTRTNMFGSSEYPFELNGEKVNFTEYVIGSAIDHYGADPASFRIKLAAAIQGHNFTRHFVDREKMEELFPGWHKDGYLKNVTNPDWVEGDPVDEKDTWQADTRSMIIDNIKTAMRNFGIPDENFDTEGIIDPGDTQGVHSSHQFSKKYGATRDLYITYVSHEDKQ